MLRPFRQAYATSKYACRGFTESLIADCRVHAPHLTVSCVMPGEIATALHPRGKMSAADASRRIIDGVREGRWHILVGDDAVILDRMLREQPEAAYGLEFWEELNAAGVMGSFPVRPVPDQSVPKLAIEGSLVLVTGGGSGMGREICVQLAAEGANIAMCDMGEDSMAETKELCLAANTDATVTTFACDVSDEAQVTTWREAVEQAHDTSGHVLLFNNAGIIGGGSFITDPRSQWELTFDVCWGGVYTCSRVFMPLLVASERAAIVNTSSVNGFFASTGPGSPHNAYCSAKFAVRGFTESLHADLRMNAPHVTPFCVMPGVITTRITGNSIRLNPIPGKTPSAELIEKAVNGMTKLQGGQTTAPPDAAATIVDDVKSGRWRILVGADAEALDVAVRGASGFENNEASPYGFAFHDALEGWQFKVESSQVTEQARAAEREGVAVAEVTQRVRL